MTRISHCFLYNDILTGSKWRSALPIDQSQCAQGELPHFVRNFYEDCRGPPRLFLLDKYGVYSRNHPWFNLKLVAYALSFPHCQSAIIARNLLTFEVMSGRFDAAGQGACVKRYTDPTFFRLNWAASQLERAERAERERQAQKEVNTLPVTWLWASPTCHKPHYTGGVYVYFNSNNEPESFFFQQSLNLADCHHTLWLRIRSSRGLYKTQYEFVTAERSISCQTNSLNFLSIIIETHVEIWWTVDGHFHWLAKCWS